VVGQSDVIGPDVELPLSQAKHAAQHGARVDADPHVQIHLCVEKREEENKGTHASLVHTKGAQHTHSWGRPKLLFTRRAMPSTKFMAHAAVEYQNMQTNWENVSTVH